MNYFLLINGTYIVAAVLFIYGLKLLTSPETARRGNLISAVGMFLAVAVTLLNEEIIDFRWLLIGIAIGSIIGALFARIVKMTQMPEMVALFNGFGGIASLLVGWGAYHVMPTAGLFVMTTIFLAVLIGGVTFSGSLVAWGKLSEILPGRPVLFRGQTLLNGALVIVMLISGLCFLSNPGTGYPIFLGIVLFSLILGVMVVIPIGGADMPVVISLLNSYSGIAACAAGLAISNNILIVSGALVGASGIILTKVMCKAMNRSLYNVLFGGFGAVKKGPEAVVEGDVKPISAQDTFFILEAASAVAFVPGYGMAVSHAQHVLKELEIFLKVGGSRFPTPFTRWRDGCRGT